MKTRLYEAALGVLSVTGLMRICGRVREGEAAILGYHGVTDLPADELDDALLHLNVEAFRQQMAFLCERFTIISLWDLVQGIRNGTKPVAGSIVLTFDDGYSNVVRCGLPILKELSIPACMFVTAGLIGTRKLQWADLLQRATRVLPDSTRFDFEGMPGWVRDWRSNWERLKTIPDELRRRFVAEIARHLPDDLEPVESRIVSEDELKTWTDAGMCVGSHTMTHPILPNVTEEELKRELGESKEALESLTQQPIKLLVYPNGDDNEAVRAAVKATGYEAACSVKKRHVRLDSDLFSLPRYLTTHSTVRMKAALYGIEALVNGR